MTENYYGYECGFCLAVVENVKNPPDRCDKCEMVRCLNCLTWLKERNGEKSKFCYGCGTIQPDTQVLFCRTSSTGCNYMEEAWIQRNLGTNSDGPYFISTGYRNPEEMAQGKTDISSWIAKRNEKGASEDVRELTEEEKRIIEGD